MFISKFELLRVYRQAKNKSLIIAWLVTPMRSVRGGCLEVSGDVDSWVDTCNVCSRC